MFNASQYCSKAVQLLNNCWIIPWNFPEQEELNPVVSLSPCSVEWASHVCKEGAWSRAASQPARAAQRRGHLYRRLDYTHTHIHTHSHTYACILSHAHTHTHTHTHSEPICCKDIFTFSPEKFSKTLLRWLVLPPKKTKTHNCTHVQHTHTYARTLHGHTLTHRHTLLHYTQSTLSHNFLWPFLVCLKPLYSS